MQSLTFSVCLDTCAQPISDSSTTSTKAVESAGLTIDNKVLPCFCLYALFEELTKAAGTSRSQITAKILALRSFLTSNGSATVNSGLQQLLNAKPVDMQSDGVFYDATLLSLFAYAFKFRIELHSENKGVPSVQYFGMKHSYIRRVLLTSDSYLLLRKKTKATLRRNDKPNGKLTLASTCLDFKSSALTLATACSQVGSPHSGPVDLFSALHSSTTQQSLGAKLISPRPTVSVCSVEDLGATSDNCTPEQGKTKTTGRLKFFNEDKEYGFIVMEDRTEVFVHKADLLRHNIDVTSLAYYKQFYEIVMEFNVQEYKGRERVNRKAVDLAIRDMIAVC